MSWPVSQWIPETGEEGMEKGRIQRFSLDLLGEENISLFLKGTIGKLWILEQTAKLR